MRTYGAFGIANPLLAISYRLELHDDLVSKHAHIPESYFASLAIVDIRAIINQVLAEALTKASEADPAFAGSVQTVPA